MVELLKNNKVLTGLNEDGEGIIDTFRYVCDECGRDLGIHQICTKDGCKGLAQPNYPSIKGKKDEFGNIFLGWFLTSPDKIKPCSLTEVYIKIMNYLKDHIYFTDEIQYQLFAYWLIGTYFKNEFKAIPYIAFIGDINSGKSRGSDIIEAIGYRTMKVSNPTNALIFRSIELYKPTLVIEEAEHSFDIKTDNGKDMLSTFNNGYTKGGRVMRLEKLEEDFIPKSFDVYCFKAMSSTRIFIPSLFSRCIKFYMQQHAIKNKDIDFTLSEDIRGYLLHLMNIKLVVKDMDAYKIPAQSRLEQISKMFYIILDNIISEGILAPDESDKMKNDLNAYIRKTYEDSIEEGKDTLEQKIIEAIHNQLSTIPTNKIYIKELAKRLLIEPDMSIEDMNSPSFKKDLKKMSVMVGLKMKVLNLKTDMGTGNMKVFNVDKHFKVLEGLYQRYLPGVDVPKPISTPNKGLFADTPTPTPKETPDKDNPCIVRMNKSEDRICVKCQDKFTTDSKYQTLCQSCLDIVNGISTQIISPINL